MKKDNDSSYGDRVRKRMFVNEVEPRGLISYWEVCKKQAIIREK